MWPMWSTRKAPFFEVRWGAARIALEKLVPNLEAKLREHAKDFLISRNKDALKTAPLPLCVFSGMEDYPHFTLTPFGYGLRTVRVVPKSPSWLDAIIQEGRLISDVRVITEILADLYKRACAQDAYCPSFTSSWIQRTVAFLRLCSPSALRSAYLNLRGVIIFPQIFTWGGVMDNLVAEMSGIEPSVPDVEDWEEFIIT